MLIDVQRGAELWKVDEGCCWRVVRQGATVKTQMLVSRFPVPEHPSAAAIAPRCRWVRVSRVTAQGVRGVRASMHLFISKIQSDGHPQRSLIMAAWTIPAADHHPGTDKAYCSDEE